MSGNNELQVRPMDGLKKLFDKESVSSQFKNALKDKSEMFMASVIDVFGSDNMLQKCSPASVIQESLKAALLNLPINKSLGFAYIVPFKGKAQMQIGYKGLIQLSLRTGQYQNINAGVVYEGQLLSQNHLTGEIKLSSERKSDKVVGYFAYFRLINGFERSEYWSYEEVHEHAKKYSKSYGSSYSPWKTAEHKMGKKTVIKSLLSTYGIMTTEMASAVTADNDNIDVPEDKANTEIIDIIPDDVDATTGEITPEEEIKIVEEEIASQEPPEDEDIPY